MHEEHLLCLGSCTCPSMRLNCTEYGTELPHRKSKAAQHEPGTRKLTGLRPARWWTMCRALYLLNCYKLLKISHMNPLGWNILFTPLPKLKRTSTRLCFSSVNSWWSRTKHQTLDQILTYFLQSLLLSNMFLIIITTVFICSPNQHIHRSVTEVFIFFPEKNKLQYQF